MNILSEIKDIKIDEVKSLRKRYSLSSFNSMNFFEKDVKSFKAKVNKASGVSVIAEIKKASPSKGIIRTDFDHRKIADIYLNAEVEAISILTDEKFFNGSLSFLSDIAGISNVPLLRKDFIIDEYQVFESKAFGADMILLICEMLSENQLYDLYAAASELDMEVLIELHSSDQITKAGDLNEKIIGINNRNLKNFSVSLENTVNIAPMLEQASVIVSESGISTREHIEKVKLAGCNAILIGEHLMKSDDISAEVIKLKEWCHAES